MPAALAVDWHAARLHLIQCNGDYSATAEAFGVKEPTLRKRAQLDGWAQELKIMRRTKDEAISQSIAKTAETLAEKGENCRLRLLDLAKIGIEKAISADLPVESWQDAKIVAEIAGKAAGFGQDTSASVQVMFQGCHSGEEMRDVTPEDAGEVVE